MLRLRLAAACVLVASIAVPSTAAIATTAGSPPVGMPGDRFPTAFPERSSPPQEGTRTRSSTSSLASAQTSLADDYYDECDDTGHADIARFGMSDDGGANVSFAWLTCVGKPMRYTSDETVLFAIDEDVQDPYFRADFVVVQWMDSYYEVHRTYDGAPPEHWALVDQGYGVIDSSDPGETFGAFTINASSVGFPYAYHFGFQTFDAQGMRDAIPNPGHPAPTFPSQCDSYLLGRKAVVRTSDTAAAVAAARAAGLDVESVAPNLGALTVSPVARLGELDLPGQTAVDRPTTYRLSAVNDPEPTQWAIDQLNLQHAWSARPSAAADIAIVDSGIDATRPDLVGRVATGFDGVTGQLIGAGANSALHPHGTGVAGIAAGTRNNGREVTGVNPGAVVRPYRVTGHNGPCVESGAVAAALDHISTVDSIRIVNMSLGGTEMDPLIREAIRRLAAKGKILVAASGNDGPVATANYPASFPEVIGVGATGPDGRIAPYSQPANAELVAPGGAGGDRSTGVAVLDEGDRIGFQSGTSFSSPYVAGALSLWLNGNRATTDQARTALRAAVTDVPGTTADGYGLLDVARLVGAGKAYPTPEARDVATTCDEHQGGPFTDTAGTAHEYTIDCVAGWKITTGRTATTYEPGGKLSRGQTATFLVRTLTAAGVAVPEADDTCAETDVHAVNLERLIAAKVVPAPADRTCGSSQAIPRAVMASWTRGALAVGGVTTTTSTDWYGDDDASPYERHINEITALGIVTGKGGGVFGPSETLSRGQMATFLARTLDALLE
ncbi:MAG: S8 family serine peptidase [Actinobacteria bacterium]|nr:S8 family serine peptidase [Actinomycetota bacterium]